MISRVAENSFWLARYLERIEIVSRILAVNRNFLLDVHTPYSSAMWHPIIVVLGEEEQFHSQYEPIKLSNMDAGELVQHYCVFSTDNLSSIYNTLKFARENARVIRETISLEMWESLNSLWLWLHQGNGPSQYEENRDYFYQYLIEHCQLFQGLLQTTLRHDEPYTFLNLGLMLERANQLARISDIAYYISQESVKPEDHAFEDARWLMLLKCFNANVAFFKQNMQRPSIEGIFNFLMTDPFFPRSAYFCCSKASELLSNMIARQRTAIGQKAHSKIKFTTQWLTQYKLQATDRTARHDHVTTLVEYIAEICELIQDEFFSTTRTLPNPTSVLQATIKNKQKVFS